MSPPPPGSPEFLCQPAAYLATSHTETILLPLATCFQPTSTTLPSSLIAGATIRVGGLVAGEIGGGAGTSEPPGCIPRPAPGMAATAEAAEEARAEVVSPPTTPDGSWAPP